ncbi:hypothetical protein MKW94_006142 [Papaver nudicaule]|uniref:Glutamate receptor n=1 Tax=Papaver nudicaule TaxID=74823 RepID=A0AA41V4L3_PAPNU|nr:hypothetical protein [Papaver nudicaule]
MIESIHPHHRKHVFSLIFSWLSILVLFLMRNDHHGILVMGQNTTIPVPKDGEEFKVGVILDSDTLLGKTGLISISMAISDFYASSTTTSHKRRLVLHIRDSNRDVVGAASAAIDLMKNVGVQAIIGPATSSQTDFTVQLGNKARVPIISFSATSPFISPNQNSYFIRTGGNDSSQVKAIAAIVKAFGWREVVLLYEDTEFGNRVVPYLTDGLQEINTRVPYRSVLPQLATDDQIDKELYKLMTMQTRVFVVHATPSLGISIFQRAKMIGMMRVLGVRPYVPRSKKLDTFRAKWRKKFLEEYPDTEGKSDDLNIYGIWAYDTAWALATAVEKLKMSTNSTGFLKPRVELKNKGDITTIGVSQIGQELLQQLSNVQFRGLSGEFRLSNRQLHLDVFQILNVVGHHGGREVGIWTPDNGIARDIGSSKTDASGTSSTSKANLRHIIWPGESINAPKGWVLPTNGKRLRIGVPVKDGFSDFVKVGRNTTNLTEVHGFCIDVFDAVMRILPYAVPYDFFAFLEHGDTVTSSYNELVYQVYTQNYDAVVGDITIIANRSQYVEFTLPFSESGVTMMVPVKKNERTNAWIFLKPLQMELWLTSAAFFVLTGVVIWVLEHRINDEFRGPVSHQIGTMFWFSFSTLVFAHKERVMSNLSRFVVIIWVFVVLILTSSYTASLTSLLTVNLLEPTFTDVDVLIKNNYNVGYQEGSFVFEMLKQKGFRVSNLHAFSSPAEFDEAFTKGSDNGGIVAAFDEKPYLKLILAQYCNKYMMVGPTYKTAGFGFAFPIGSPLVHDISRAILEVTEGDEMTKIEAKLGDLSKKCPVDVNPMTTSSSLTLDSFWGLFLIAGVSSTLAIVIFLICFLREHQNSFSRTNDSDTSIWQRVIHLARHFDHKDLSSHTFRKAYEVRDGHSNDDISPGASPSTFTLPYTPRDISVDTSPSIFTMPNSPDILNQARGTTFCPWEDHTTSSEIEDGANSSNQEMSTTEESKPT